MHKERRTRCVTDADEIALATSRRHPAGGHARASFWTPEFPASDIGCSKRSAFSRCSGDDALGFESQVQAFAPQRAFWPLPGAGSVNPFAALPKLDTKVLCNSSWSGGFRSELPAHEGAYLGLERVTLRERNAISIILKHHDTQESVYQLKSRGRR